MVPTTGVELATYPATSDRPSGKLTSLPADLILEIAEHLDSKANVLHLALSSRHLFLSICPALYSSVQLDSAEQCETTLKMLDQHPYTARHVRELVIRFLPCSTVHSLDLNGHIISNLVQRLAPKLDALNAFIWDAEEMPQRDDLWFALRMSCPRLRTIGVAYGSELPESHSYLFQFKNLRGFTLNLKRGFYERYADLQELPSEHRLWDMLIRRSPDLEELHIAGTPFSPLHSVHPLCHARWPRLHTLSLGDILLDWEPRAGVKPPFISFLEAHPALRSLRTSRAALNPALLSSLELGSLPKLTHFGGCLEHLQGLANVYHQLTSVALDQPLVIRDLAPLLVPGVLQGLRSLTELRICFIFQSAYEGGSLIRSIANACPSLVNFEVICAQRPSFTIDTLSKTIRALPRLRHLRVTAVRSPHEDPLPVCAALVARTNPRLHTFSITFIPPSLPLPVPFGMPICHRGSDPGHPYVETGNYMLKTDDYGLLTSVVCTERRPTRLLPFPISTFAMPTIMPAIIFGSSRRSTNRSVKKYSYTLDMRPGAKRKRGWGLLLERSAAGEEVRVLTVLVSLSGLALWGFFT